MRTTPATLAIGIICTVLLTCIFSSVEGITSDFGDTGAGTAATTLLGCAAVYLILGLLGIRWQRDTAKALATVAGAIAFTFGLHQAMESSFRATHPTIAAMDASGEGSTWLGIRDEPGGCASRVSNDATPAVQGKAQLARFVTLPEQAPMGVACNAGPRAAANERD